MKQEHSAGGRPAFIDPTPDNAHGLTRSWPLVAGRVACFARREDVDDLLPGDDKREAA